MQQPANHLHTPPPRTRLARGAGGAGVRPVALSGLFMWNVLLTNVAEVLNETWLVLLIGVGTAGLAFAVGWTTLRKRKAPPAAAAAPGRLLGPNLDPFTGGGAQERRAAARRGGHPVTVDLVDPDAQMPAQQGWVLDRSVGGLCLKIPHSVPTGSFWKVRPTDAPRTTPPVRVEVKTCVPYGGDWKLNCQFEKTPSYAVLLTFG